MAKPRVFLSSTYYDLKHVRERIERFLTNFGMEPVLFESDNVTFEFGKPLDLSCYNEVKLCHMMVLIVGGRYGSAATGQKEDKEQMNQKDSYEKYVSITRKEYETALSLGIPVFVFIDKNVLAGHETYKKNKEFFESGVSFNFAHVDDVNIFRFISTLENTNAIKTFDKVEEIENYLESQISGMLFLYLQELQIRKRNNETLDAIVELKNISQRMNAMVAAIGENILKDSDIYTGVIRKQNIIIFRFYKDYLFQRIELMKNISATDIDLKKDKEELLLFLFNEADKAIEEGNKSSEVYYNTILAKIDNQSKNRYLNMINDIDLCKIFEKYLEDIYPIVKNDIEMKEKFFKVIFNDEN